MQRDERFLSKITRMIVLVNHFVLGCDDLEILWSESQVAPQLLPSIATSSGESGLPSPIFKD